MNYGMQSSLLKIICCISTIIDVTFCMRCFEVGCAASCYFSQRGFDYGHCENGICKCSPPAIYLFDGIDRGLRDESFEYLLKNEDHGQNLVSTMSTTYTANEIKRYEIWEEIETLITEKYSFIKSEDLKNLKAKVIGDQLALNYLFMYLKKPLNEALEAMKKKKPDTSEECNELLKLFLKQNNDKNKRGNSPPVTPSLTRGLTMKQNDLPNKLTAANAQKNVSTKNSSHKSVVFDDNTDANNNRRNNNSIISKKPVEDKNKPNEVKQELANNPKEKLQRKKTVEEEEEKKHEIFYEVSEETVEYSDESEEPPKKTKEKVTEKPRAEKNNKANDDDDDGSGSYYYEDESTAEK